jgi:hypothetical protein
MELVGLVSENRLISKSFKMGRGGWVKKKDKPSFA